MIGLAVCMQHLSLYRFALFSFWFSFLCCLGTRGSPLLVVTAGGTQASLLVLSSSRLVMSSGVVSTLFVFDVDLHTLLIYWLGMLIFVSYLSCPCSALGLRCGGRLQWLYCRFRGGKVFRFAFLTGGSLQHLWS